MAGFLSHLLALQRIQKQAFLIIFDCAVLAFCFFLAMWLRLDSLSFVHDITIWSVLVPTIPFCIGFFILTGVYRSVLRYLSVDIIKGIGFGLSLSAVTMLLCSQIFSLPVPRSVPGIFLAFAVISISGARFFMLQLFHRHLSKTSKDVVIYGAGEAGRQLVKALKQGTEYTPKFFIDDNVSLIGQLINGLPVYSFKEAKNKLTKARITTILLAIPSVNRAVRKAILNRLNPLNLEIKTIPGMSDLIEGRIAVSDLRQVSIEELLERDTIPAQPELMEPTIRDKVVLVTGAGGSIGSELCREITRYAPRKLILLDNSEHNLYQIERELIQTNKLLSPPVKLMTVLGSIADECFVSPFIREQKIDTIYHAAAFKHVPLVEKNSIAAIKNNVLGTEILAIAAVHAKVKHFILISTDKAVRPTNIMGATKRLAELICQSLAQEEITTCFALVRFGNVMGSNGSVIPLFREQIQAGGPLTVTHPDITRYFMTIAEAAQLVIQAAALSKGGEVFHLDMGSPVKILDLAKRMANLYGLKPQLKTEFAAAEGDIEIVITGLRPGEKLYEELLIDSNAKPTSHSRIMTADEISVNRQDLEKLLKMLAKSCRENDTDTVKQLLRTAPIGFKPALP